MDRTKSYPHVNRVSSQHIRNIGGGVEANNVHRKTGYLCKEFLNNLIQSVKSLILGSFYLNTKYHETRLSLQK